MVRVTRSAVLSLAVLAALVAAAALACGGERAAEKKQTLENLPSAAAKALEAQTGGAEISALEQEADHGVPLHEATWREDGVTRSAKVTGDGDLVELEEAMAPDAVPSRVREAVKSRFPGAGKIAFEKKTLVRYEVEVEVDGTRREVLLTPTGRVVPDDDDEGDDRNADDEDEEGEAD